VPGTVAIFIPMRVFAHAPANASALSVAAGLLLLTGSSIYSWCIWDFATAGRGTPAPIDPPRTLVVRGLYQYVRNPMYVGVLSVVGGWATLFQSSTLAVYMICMAAGFHLFVLLFGTGYENYCSQVNRWVPIGKRRSPA
jgi:protein-S-isoprenylcysteine O-methyltransferase Ste14